MIKSKLLNLRRKRIENKLKKESKKYSTYLEYSKQLADIKRKKELIKKLRSERYKELKPVVENIKKGAKITARGFKKIAVAYANAPAQPRKKVKRKIHKKIKEYDDFIGSLI